MARAKQRIPEEPKRNDNLKLLMLCVAGLVVGLGFAMLSWKLYAASVAMQSPPLPPFATEELPAIPVPDLAAAPALPDQAALAQAASEHAEAVAAAMPPLWADADEAVTLA
nr:hypothetical protein [Planctomycetota bacterium]